MQIKASYHPHVIACDKAELACYESIVRFLQNPTDQLRVVAESKIEGYANIIDSKQIIEDVNKTFYKLESNDFETWQKLAKLLTVLFNDDQEIIYLFYKAAHKRNIEIKNT